MNSPKIRVGADFSAVEDQVKRLQAKVESVNKSLSGGSVGIDVKQAKADLASLEAQANKVVAALDAGGKGKTPAGVGQIGKVTFALDEAAKAAGTLEQVLDAVGQSSGTGGAVKNAKAVADHISRAARAQRDLAREGLQLTREQAVAAKEAYDKLRTSGARGTSHFKSMDFDKWIGGGWQNESVNLADARRKRRAVLRRIGLETPEPSGAGGSEVDRARGQRVGGMNWNQMARRFGGVAGGVATGVASGGGLGIGPVAGGLAGTVPGAGLMLGPLAGALGGIIDKALERALSEATDLADMRRAMGAATVDFEQLRQNTRLAADGLGLTYNEAAKLAKQFAHTANVSSDRAGIESGKAAGFARAYGIDPASAVQFFGTMRHYGATQSEKDSKRLALAIAEAINAGGISAKADEALSAIGNYVETASRASMTEANVRSYASFMSSLTGLSMYGIKGDPMAAAGAMGAADAALRQGGAFGEASKAFSLGTYQRMLPGFSSFDMEVLNEQGAFGSIGRAFGKNSPAYALAKARGDKAKMAQYDQWAGMGGDTSILDLQMRALEDYYGGSTDELRKAMQSHLGVSAPQASALYQAYKSDRGLGGLQAALEGAGVNLDTLGTRQIASLAEVAGGSNSTVRKQAEKLLGLDGADALSGSEKMQLQQALAEGKPEEIRKVVLGLSALHDTTKDEGDEMRTLTADIQNSTQRIATQLIPLATKANEYLLRIANVLAPETAPGSHGASNDNVAWSPNTGWEWFDDTFSVRNGPFKGGKSKQREVGNIDADLATNQRGIDAALAKMSPKERADMERARENFLRASANLRNAKTPQDQKRLAGARDTWAAELMKYPAAQLYAQQAKLQRERAAAGQSGGGRSRLDDRGPISNFMRAVRSAESGGNDQAKNSRSSASGRYQFTRGTWLGTYEKEFGDTGESGKAIWAKRWDPDMQDRLMRRLTEDNAQALRRAGLPVNETTLYLAHFAGVGGAIKLLKARPGTSATGLLGSAVARANSSVVAGKSAAQVIDWASDSIGNHKISARIPAEHVGNMPAMAVSDLRIDNRVMIMDRNGNEMGNTVTQVQTRAGSPVPAGLMQR